MKFIAVAIMALTISGCANYQIGDVSKTLHEKRQEYCQETDPVTRYLLLKSMEDHIEEYPEGGICVDWEDRLLNEDNVSD